VKATLGGTRATEAQKSGTVVWASTSLQTKGGITTFVNTMRATPLSNAWDIEHVATHCNGSVLARTLAFARGLVRFLRLVVGRRPDLVHLHTAKDASVARKAALLWVARAVRVPVVLHVHTGDFGVFYDRMPRPVRWCIRRTLGRASAVVALGQLLARRLQHIAPNAQIIAIPNGIRIVGRSRRAGGNEPVHVVFLGEIGARKGAFRLLDAWSKLVTDGSNLAPARLTIAGDGDVDRARAVVARLHLAESVQVHSWLSPAEVADLLGTAHVLALPSRSEGQPMAVLEAMARGLCVVASTVDGIPELIEDGASGVLVAPNDVDALATALRTVINDHELRDRLGDAALDRARQTFDLDVIWRRFDVLYRELTGHTDGTIGTIGRKGS
jgi:glycosyltransferase involved in cell wall biosynthesis